MMHYPLSASEGNESWNTSAYGEVQTNKRKLQIVNLSMAGAYHLRPGLHATVGVDINTLSFNRFAFATGSGDISKLRTDLASQGKPAFTISQGAITEDLTNIILNIGLRYDSFFASADEPFRFIVGVQAGIPAYYSAENTSLPDLTWKEFFKGFDLNAEFGAGVKIYERFSFLGMFEAFYSQRDETSRIDVGNGLSARIPEIETKGFRVTANFNWIF